MGADAGRGCLAMEGLARNATTGGGPDRRSLESDGRCAPNADAVTTATKRGTTKLGIRILRVLTGETKFMICVPEAELGESHVK